MNRFNSSSVLTIGNSWAFNISILTASHEPQDLTGATVTMAIGSGPSHRLLEAIATISSPSTAGLCSVALTPTQTKAIPPDGNTLWYQINVVYGSGLVDTVAAGTLTVQGTMI